MERWITSAKLIVLCLFMALSAGAIAYQMYVVWPPQHCEAKGAWWDPRDRQCLIPIPIERFTGRAMSALPGFRPVVGSPPAPTAHPPAHAR